MLICVIICLPGARSSAQSAVLPGSSPAPQAPASLAELHVALDHRARPGRLTAVAVFLERAARTA